jgi:hypothetical protein
MLALQRRSVSWTMRQHVTPLLTGSMRTRRRAMRRFAAFCAREYTATRLLGRHDELDVIERKREAAKILEQPAASGSGVGHRLGNPLFVGTACVGVTQK